MARQPAQASDRVRSCADAPLIKQTSPNGSSTRPMPRSCQMRRPDRRRCSWDSLRRSNVSATASGLETRIDRGVLAWKSTSQKTANLGQTRASRPRRTWHDEPGRGRTDRPKHLGRASDALARLRQRSARQQQRRGRSDRHPCRHRDGAARPGHVRQPAEQTTPRSSLQPTGAVGAVGRDLGGVLVAPKLSSSLT